MKSKFVTFLLCLHFLGIAVVAQNSVRRQVVLQLSNGGFVAFKSQTSETGSKNAAGSQSLASLIYSQALADENRIIHRVITDDQQRVIFGYDLWVSSDPLTRKFNLAVLPADDAFRRSFMKDSAPRTSDLFATFPKSTKPQTLDDGDAISLELLINPQSGIKIVDLVRVTFDQSSLFESAPGVPPKDFTLDAVSLTVRNYELFIDGSLVGKSKSTNSCSGALLWLYVPDLGRFIFSLVPREGYLFQKVGVVDGNRIEFFASGRYYEWVSSTPILPGGTTWSLWVLPDPKYSPLFGNNKPLPKESKQNVFERLEDAVKTNIDYNALAVRSQWPKVPKESNKVVVPLRILVGGADSMDHLLPKNP